MQFLAAFLLGGLFCAAAEILILKTKVTPARILVGYVVLGVVLGGLGIYKPLLDIAGAGASVPLTGFGNTLACGVQKAVDERGFLGIFSGGFTACSCGIGAVIFFGLLSAICFRSKPYRKQKKN